MLLIFSNEFNDGAAYWSCLRIQLEFRWEVMLIQSYKPISVYSYMAFEKSNKTKNKPDTRNINQEQNLGTKTVLPNASKAGNVAKGRVCVTRFWELNVLQTTKWEMGRLTNFPSTLLFSSLKQYHPCYRKTYTDSEEQALSIKPKLSHSIGRHTWEKFLVSSPFYFS